MRKYALYVTTTLSLLMCGQTSAQDARYVRHVPTRDDFEIVAPMRDCPRVPDVMGHRALVGVSEGQRCDRDQARPYGYIDDRLGVQFHAPQYHLWIPSGVAVEPAAVDPADAGKLCLRGYPDGAVEEWIVPKGKACTKQWTRYSRRYYNGMACIFPADYCVAIDALTPVGRERAQASIDRVKGSSLAKR